MAYSFRRWLTTESAPPSFHSNNRKHMVSAKLLTQLVIGYAVSLPLLFAYGTYFGHGLARTASAYGALLLLVILILFAMFRHWLGKQRMC